MEDDRKKMLRNLITNAFSVDVESFVESNLQSFNIPAKYQTKSQQDYEIERNTGVLLEILAEMNTMATFFFLGRIAEDIPNLVKTVADAGHEPACHSHLHIRVFGIEPSEFKVKITEAKHRLEDVSGRRVYGFRAPDFSITEKSIWALDILKEAGFVYDSSIYPFGLHDVYGIKEANPLAHTLPNGLVEFPMSTIKLLGKRVPFGGGGYFRLYPLWLTKMFISILNKRAVPCMSYIHPYEVGPAIPKISELSAYRKVRHYHHCKTGDRRVKKLLKAFKFAPVVDVLKQHGLITEE